MATIEVAEANFEEITKRSGIVLLDWWATWCGPCRVFAPVFESASEKYKDMVFGKINTEDQQALSKRFAVRSIPTLMLFRDGVMLYSKPGAIPAAALEDLIKQAQGIDMVEVRRKVEEFEKSKQKPA
ncbi:thioredoxin [Hyalangium sp.]|uniref:thioredoxin n=1 Tax=Hyalangium sp. TaxID=2028555 RepID=UPI002D4CD286|nr:thioredoxin [Hyalangium sp.]HYH95631.1 thioredoxin [Hyalangium sp.]